ncbi:MAG TPA: nitrite reductase small subunit NirD [Stellaceae bacterium]|nr:nitrite reductase small subunit NirD [Stellaceae bacterium]
MADTCWIEIGDLADIPRRGARRVTRPGAALPIAVFRTAEDEIFALVDRCPHKDGPLSEGIVQGCAVACPLHGWVIQLDSGEAEAPDEGSTRAIPVKVEAGRIWLHMPSLEICDL